MAPFTCKVVDSFHCGIPGVLASLRCKDQHGRLVSTFESYTDSDGDVKAWLRAPFSSNSQAETVDIYNTPLLSVSFSLPPSFLQKDVPWVKIQTEVYLTSEFCHGVVLHLFDHLASYRFEHIRKPAAGPFKCGNSSCDFDLMDCDVSYMRTPSPLQLPPSVLDDI